jgi:glycosyltransferase involved in cell wall biosynthesis
MGVSDLVRDGENGLLVAPDDVAALGAALARLRDDPAFAARLGGAGRATAETFAWDRVVPCLEEVLERWSSK